MRPFLPLLFALALSSTLAAQSIFDSTYVFRTTTVFFAFGSADVLAETLTEFDKLAVWAGRDPRFAGILITAHTDSIGTALSNEKLAANRASALRQALIDRGLPAEKIQTIAEGEGQPVTGNYTEEGRQRNRRATIKAIIAVPMVQVSGRIKSGETEAALPDALLTFRSKTRLDSARTDSSGRYSVSLPRDTAVAIEVVAKDHFFKSYTLQVYGSPELMKKYRQNPNLTLPSAKPGAKLVLDDLFFVGDQAVLLKFSEPELPKILRFMQINPALCIEVAGHINSPENHPGDISKRQWKLSVDRARLVYDYLVAKGVSPDRISYKGYGNLEMLFPNPRATSAEQQMNRRVEIRVIAKKETR